jgi:hypothetical protein
MPDVSRNPTGACHDTDEAEGLTRLWRERPDLLETCLHRWLVPEELHRLTNVADRLLQPREHLDRSSGLHVEADPSRAHHAATEAAPAEERSQVEKISADAAAVRRGG